MRIQQLVKSYALQASQRPNSVAGANPALAGAKRFNQARVTDSAKGFVQASKVRDGIAAVSTSVDKARAAVKKAQAVGVSAADKQKAQADFAKALAGVDSGAKDQSAAIADSSLANNAYNIKKAGVTSVDRLGQGASAQFNSVASLASLDLTTASSDQLDEAIKVLDAATTETGTQLTVANAKVATISGRLDLFETVQSTLDGTTQEGADTTKKRDIASLLVVIQRSQSLVPGSFFSSFG